MTENIGSVANSTYPKPVEQPKKEPPKNHSNLDFAKPNRQHRRADAGKVRLRW